MHIWYIYCIFGSLLLILHICIFGQKSASHAQVATPRRRGLARMPDPARPRAQDEYYTAETRCSAARRRRPPAARRPPPRRDRPARFGHASDASWTGLSAGPVGRKPAAPDTVTVGLFLEPDACPRDAQGRSKGPGGGDSDDSDAQGRPVTVATRTPGADPNLKGRFVATFVPWRFGAAPSARCRGGAAQHTPSCNSCPGRSSPPASQASDASDRGQRTLLHPVC